MITLVDLVRSESVVELDFPDTLDDPPRGRMDVDVVMHTFMTPRVSWRRQDLAEVSVNVTATRQWLGGWYVYAYVNHFIFDTFGNVTGGGGCLGDSSAFFGASRQDYCQEDDIEAVAAAALEAAMTEAVDTPFLDPMEKMRWLAALAAPPRDLY